MATIPINDKYQIGSDRRSWFIQERRKKRDGFYWEPVAWFRSLEQTLESLGNRMVRESSAQGIGELLDEAERVSSTLSRALTSKKDQLEGVNIQLPDPDLIESFDFQIPELDLTLDTDSLDLQLPDIEGLDLQVPKISLIDEVASDEK